MGWQQGRNRKREETENVTFPARPAAGERNVQPNEESVSLDHNEQQQGVAGSQRRFQTIIEAGVLGFFPDPLLPSQVAHCLHRASHSGVHTGRAFPWGLQQLRGLCGC